MGLLRLSLPVLLFPLAAGAQVPTSTSAEPLMPQSHAAAPSAAPHSPRPLPRSFRMAVTPPPAIALAAPTDAQVARVRKHPTAVGLTRPLSADTAARGAWSSLPDGTPVWQLMVQSSGALGVRVHFTNFGVGNGEVWVYSPNAKQVRGPYTAKGIFGDGDFWSDVVVSNAAVVEYIPATGDRVVPFALSAVEHLGSDGQTSFTGMVKAHAQMPQCYSPNASSYSAWSSQASAVGLMLFVSIDGLSYFCTGNLVNDLASSGRPLFLTANHCISTEAEAKSLIVYWNYDSQPPPGFDYESQPDTVGAHLLATAPVSEGDGSLLELAARPPSTAGYAGWSAAELPVGSTVAGLSHPAASWKRMAFGNTGVSETGWMSEGITPRDYFIETDWYMGATEPGSSGSGLFDTVGHHLFGMDDSGNVGEDMCPMFRFAYHGKLSTFYPRIQPWLTGTAPGTCTISLSAVNHSAPVTGETGAFTVNAPPNCSWAAASDNDWITVNPKVGAGSGTVTYTVGSNMAGQSTPQLGSFSVMGEQRHAVHISQPGTDTSSPYSDVPPSHQFYKEIAVLKAENGIADPCAVGKLCPDDATTRGTMAQFIIRSIYGGEANIPPAASAVPYFADVPPTDPLYRYIQEMAYLGITKGCTTTTYCPDRSVTRGEMSVFIIRALQAKNLLTNDDTGLTQAEFRSAISADGSLINTFPYAAAPSFTDVPAANSFFPYIQRMKDLGVTAGCSTTQYCPDDPNTRGQISVFLARGLFVLWNSRPY